MENFEQKLKRLEELSSAIKKSDISLEDALSHFEEGIKLAQSMQQYLDEMEGKVQILMNPQAFQPSSGGGQEDSTGDAKPRKGSKGKADGRGSKGNAKGLKGQDQDVPDLALFNDTSDTTASSSDIKGTRA